MSRPDDHIRESPGGRFSRLAIWIATFAAMLLSLVRTADPTGVVRAADPPAARAEERKDIPLEPGTVVRLATAEEAREVLGRRDRFVAAMSRFDRSLRLRTSREVTEEALLQFVAGQALDWRRDEEDKLSRIVASLGKKIARLELSLPPVVLLVKTTGEEESGAAYCRGHAIMLPRKLAEQSSEGLEGLLTHELFHILSTHDPELREALYQVIGFRACNEIELPADLRDRKITNPDAPNIDHSIEVQHEGRPVQVAPVLFSSQPRYDETKGGGIFDYLTFKLLAIEKVDEKWQAQLANGKPLLFDVAELEGFHEQVGRNTGYIIHPEEILADNFGMLVRGQRDVPTPRILEEMGRVIAEHARGK